MTEAIFTKPRWIMTLGIKWSWVRWSTKLSGRWSKKCLRLAKAKIPDLGSKVCWWQADICDIIDQLGKFHGILSITAFEFISRPDWILAKLYSCLEPGRRLFFSPQVATAEEALILEKQQAGPPARIYRG